MPKLKLNPQHQALKELAHMILKRWKKAFDNSDEDISGCDAVDSLGCYVELAEDALAQEPSQPTVKKRRNSATDPTAILKEWVADVGALVDGEGHLKEFWPDMFLTYQKAKALVKKGR